MAPNRPLGRKKNVQEGGTGAARRGEGRGQGPVGSSSGMHKRPSGSAGGGSRATKIGGGLSLPLIIIAAIYMFMSGGFGSSTGSPQQNYVTPEPTANYVDSGSYSNSSSGSSFNDFYDYFTQQGGSGISQDSIGLNVNPDTPAVDTAVSSGTPGKRTEILGNGQDVITLMVYMCGTDLESRSSMGTSDLVEMTRASLGSNINLLVYTGGCSRWQNNVVSSSVNQIYKITNGKMERLVADDGSKVMTDPATLSSFIQWCAANYPANRYDLIFWDHGGGSISGYGYDEKAKSSGSMDLAEIHRALSEGGVVFDFIGFDACLMATAETALVTARHADYMIASEETEPGIGWYYTDWLTKLGSNPSMPTTEIGKNIIDDFTAACARKCRGQATTLSLIDLAEFAEKVPEKLTAFSSSVRRLIADKEYRTVSNARYGTREFAVSSRIDQVDLVDLATKMGTPDGRQLAKTLQDAIKYNRTSASMTNAYGVSIYFPYQRAKYVDSMCSTYSAIGMDEEYTRCIREFASLETSGQIAAGGSATGNPYGSLFSGLLGGAGSQSASQYGDLYGQLLGSLFDGGSSSGDSDMISSMLGAFLSGGRSLIDGLSEENTSFMKDSALSRNETVQYITENSFDASQLKWLENPNGSATMNLSEEQWSLVHGLDLNLFYDDGAGYADLGLDNIFDFDDDGNLVADTSRNWLAINGQVVAYYHQTTSGDENDYVITGYVPALLNGEEVRLQLVFDSENPDGYVAGATCVYDEDVNLTLSKELTEIKAGDTLDFLCDFYDYHGEFQDNYFLGQPLTVGPEPLTITNVNVGEGAVKLMYRFTDIYNQEYWTPVLDR